MICMSKKKDDRDLDRPIIAYMESTVKVLSLRSYTVGSRSLKRNLNSSGTITVRFVNQLPRNHDN